MAGGDSHHVITLFPVSHPLEVNIRLIQSPPPKPFLNNAWLLCGHLERLPSMKTELTGSTSRRQPHTHPQCRTIEGHTLYVRTDSQRLWQVSADRMNPHIHLISSGLQMYNPDRRKCPQTDRKGMRRTMADRTVKTFQQNQGILEAFSPESWNLAEKVQKDDQNRFKHNIIHWF